MLLPMLKRLLIRIWDWLYWNRGGSVYASFERRLMANMIDTLLVSVVIYLFFAPLMQIAEPVRAHVLQLLAGYQQGALSEAMLEEQFLRYMQEEGLHLLLQESLWQLGILAVFLLGSWKWRNTTPGKWLLNMEIVDARTGGAPHNWQFVVRFFGYFIAALPFMIGFVSIMWHRKRQGWHDRLAGTVVLVKQKPQPI